MYFHSHFTHNNCHLWVQTNVLMIQFLYLGHSIKCLQTNIAVYIFFFGYKLCCMYSGHSFYVCLQIQQLSIYFSYEMSYDACVLDTPFMHTNTAAAHIFFIWEKLWFMYFGHSLYVCIQIQLLSIYFLNPLPTIHSLLTVGRQTISTSQSIFEYKCKQIHIQIQNINTNANMNTNTNVPLHILPQPCFASLQSVDTPLIQVSPSIQMYK